MLGMSWNEATAACTSHGTKHASANERAQLIEGQHHRVQLAFLTICVAWQNNYIPRWWMLLVFQPR